MDDRLSRCRFVGVSIFMSLASVLPLSCSFDYEGATIDEALAEETPESRIVGLSQTVVENGTTSFEIEAESVEVYEGHTKTVAYGVRFREYDAEGDLLTEGRADRAVFRNETEDAEFEGNVRLHAVKEELVVETDRVEWNSEERRLLTPPDSRVRLEKEDGSFLEGRGFEADLRRRYVRFQAAVKGYYVVNDEEEGSENGVVPP
jgi:LPS export ABC transporter protein LptC